MSKRLFMLSKVSLVGLLASGSTITCIDQSYAALYLAWIQVLREFSQDLADHPMRAWLVEDYEADASLVYGSSITTLSGPALTDR